MTLTTASQSPLAYGVYYVLTRVKAPVPPLLWLAGRRDLFVLAAAIYAMGTAIIGASPAAYAADVMPADAAGLGLGIYRCAGDLGALRDRLEFGVRVGIGLWLGFRT